MGQWEDMYRPDNLVLSLLIVVKNSQHKLNSGPEHKFEFGELFIGLLVLGQLQMRSIIQFNKRDNLTLVMGNCQHQHLHHLWSYSPFDHHDHDHHDHQMIIMPMKLVKGDLMLGRSWWQPE